MGWGPSGVTAWIKDSAPAEGVTLGKSDRTGGISCQILVAKTGWLSAGLG